MKECRETITVFNRKFNTDTGFDEWRPTTIKGVSLFTDLAATVTDNGLKTTATAKIRIPIDADTSGKVYVDSKGYESIGDVEGFYTYQTGDLIVFDTVTEQKTPAELSDMYSKVYTILTFIDSRSRPHGKHVKLVCE